MASCPWSASLATPERCPSIGRGRGSFLWNAWSFKHSKDVLQMLKMCFLLKCWFLGLWRFDQKSWQKSGSLKAPPTTLLRQAIASDHRWYPQLQQGIEGSMPGLLSNKSIHTDSYLDARDSYSSHMVNHQSYIVYSSITLPFLVVKKREMFFHKAQLGNLLRDQRKPHLWPLTSQSSTA